MPEEVKIAAYHAAVQLKNSDNESYWSKFNAFILANSIFVLAAAQLWGNAVVTLLFLFGVFFNGGGIFALLRAESFHDKWLKRAQVLEEELEIQVLSLEKDKSGCSVKKIAVYMLGGWALAYFLLVFLLCFCSLCGQRW